MVTWAKDVIATVQGLWLLIPSKTRSFLLSQAFQLQTALIMFVAIGYTDPQIACCKTLGSTLQYIHLEWWTVVLALVFGVGPVYRAMKAQPDPPSTSPDTAPPAQNGPPS